MADLWSVTFLNALDIASIESSTLSPTASTFWPKLEVMARRQMVAKIFICSLSGDLIVPSIAIFFK